MSPSEAARGHDMLLRLAAAPIHLVPSDVATFTSSSTVSTVCGSVLGMGMGGARAASSPMHSPVNWALLGLIIARPSYAYELARRFERTYEGALSLSSVSHIYTALATLRERGLVREAGGGEGASRSRRRYEATAAGLASHEEWLVAQVEEDRRRQRLLVAQLGALAGTPGRAGAVLDEYEQACIAVLAAAPLGADGTPGVTGLVARLTGEEVRQSVAAKLRWVQYARVQLRALAESQAPREPDGPA